MHRDRRKEPGFRAYSSIQGKKFRIDNSLSSLFPFVSHDNCSSILWEYFRYLRTESTPSHTEVILLRRAKNGTRPLSRFSFLCFFSLPEKYIVGLQAPYFLVLGTVQGSLLPLMKVIYSRNFYLFILQNIVGHKFPENFLGKSNIPENKKAVLCLYMFWSYSTVFWPWKQDLDRFDQTSITTNAEVPYSKRKILDEKKDKKRFC